MRVRTKEHDAVDLRTNHEITINEYLKSNPIKHLGKDMVRRVLDLFEIAGPNRNHKYMLYHLLRISFTEYLSIQLLLIALDYLHQCYVVHTSKLSII